MLLLVLGLLLTMLACDAARTGFAQRAWPTITGRITELRLETKPGLFGWRDPEQDRLRVRYSYAVGGEDFEGTDISQVRIIGVPVRVQGDFERILQQYQENAEVTIYYNPRDLAEAVLEPGPGFYTFTSLAVGVALIGVALLI